LRDSSNTLEILRHNQTDPLPARSQLIPRTPLQWVIVALVKALNVIAIEALVAACIQAPSARTAGSSSTANRIASAAVAKRR